MNFIFGLLLGLALGALLMYLCGRHRRRGDTLNIGVHIPMNIKATARYPLGPVRFTDNEGNTVPRPAGSTIEWSQETTVGTLVAEIFEHRDFPGNDEYREIEGGDNTSEGFVKATVTIPRDGQDPLVISGSTTLLVVVPGDVDSVAIPVGDELPS